MGHLPGSCCRICGCMEQVHSVTEDSVEVTSDDGICCCFGASHLPISIPSTSVTKTASIKVRVCDFIEIWLIVVIAVAVQHIAFGFQLIIIHFQFDLLQTVVQQLLFYP